MMAVRGYKPRMKYPYSVLTSKVFTSSTPITQFAGVLRTQSPMSEVYTVKRNDKVGRYVVAAKDLRAGEEMLVEWPVAVGPKASSPAVCLGCYCPWPSGDSDGEVCEECGWPVCGPQCANQTLHKDSECAVFAAARVRYNAQAESEVPGMPSPQFECITPLRMLLAKDSQTARWDAEVAEMEAHTEERKAQPDWATEHINVVEFLRRKCRLADRFSEDLIHWAIGVLEVNAFEVRTDDGYFIRGLYPLTAIMSHNCVANTTHTIYPTENFRSQVRVTINVPEGGELFASYTSSIQPTLLRRENIKYSKYFDCDCERCADPTELGTHLSSLKCTKCDNGIITSTNSLDNEAVWKCSHCEFTIRADTVRKIFNMIQGEIEQIENIEGFDSKIQEAEKLLKKFKSVLHPRHVYLTSLRHSLLQLYGRAPGYTFFDLPDILLERKIELCRQVLEVVDVVKPGMNRFRGLVLYELHVPLMIFNRNRYEYKELSKEEFKKCMEEVVQILQESINILCLEDPNSPEGKIGVVGKDSLEQLKISIDQL